MQIKIRLTNQTRKKVLQWRDQAIATNNLSSVKSIEALLYLSEGRAMAEVAERLSLAKQTIGDYIRPLLCNLVGSIADKQSPKNPPILKVITSKAKEDERVAVTTRNNAILYGILSPIINQLSPKIEDLSYRNEKLLYWLSVLGCGTRESFNKACEALKLEEPTSILRKLKLLGHLEVSENGKRWSAAPTAIVKISSDSDFPEFMLCGQRSICLLRQLKEYTDVTSVHQSKGDAPPCIRIKISAPSLITSKVPLCYVGEVSLKIAEILPDIATWKQSLSTLQGIVPSFYEWERFDVYKDCFEPCSFPSETGMYKLHQESNNHFSRTLFYDRENDLWRQGDWYGLRFLHLSHTSIVRQALYSISKQRLAIPVSQRWPEIYERALVLASGQLPTYQDSWLLYENVPMEVISLLTDKLNVKCSEVPASA